MDKMDIDRKKWDKLKRTFKGSIKEGSDHTTKGSNLALKYVLNCMDICEESNKESSKLATVLKLQMFLAIFSIGFVICGFVLGWFES